MICRIRKTSSLAFCYMFITSALKIQAVGFSETLEKHVSTTLHGAASTRQSSSTCPTFIELIKRTETHLCKKKGKVSPLQVLVWPRGWVDV